MSALANKFAALLAEAEALGHSGLDELRSVWHRITGEVPQLEQEALADGHQVVADAEAAAKPVVAEAEGDAKQLLDEAVTDVESAVQPPASA